ITHRHSRDLYPQGFTPIIRPTISVPLFVPNYPSHPAAPHRGDPTATDRPPNSTSLNPIPIQSGSPRRHQSFVCEEDKRRKRRIRTPVLLFSSLERKANLPEVKPRRQS